MLLSIIIPVYNAQKYLDECLKSILSSASTEFELILINDGSKDESVKIITGYMQKDARVMLFNKENGGVSRARNRGIEKATGSYIMFVDADDRMEEGGIDILLKALRNTKKDFFLCNFCEINDKSEPYRYTYVCEQIKTDREILDKLLVTGFYLNTCWGKIYNKDILENCSIRFSENMKIGEDFVFVADFLENSRDFGCIPEMFYGYRQVDEGAVRTNRACLDEQNIFDIQNVFRRKINYAIKRNLKDTVINLLYKDCVANISANIHLVLKRNRKLSTECHEINNFLKAQLMQQILRQCICNEEVSKRRKILCIILKVKIIRIIYIVLEHMIIRFKRGDIS